MVNVRPRKPYSRPPVDGQWLHDKAPIGGGNDVVSATNGAPTKGTKLVVAGLHYEITPKDLNAIFGQVGTLISEPFIRYDRSGRSTGVAIISYETPAEATKALKQFNGLLAKGQPMAISYDTSMPRPFARKSSTTSLLNRIQKQPLLQRLTGNTEKPEDSRTERTGPIRSRGHRGGRGGGRGRGARAPRRPQTAEDLDKELEAFMGDDSAPTQQPVEEGKIGADGGTQAQDVDMA